MFHSIVSVKLLFKIFVTNYCIPAWVTITPSDAASGIIVFTSGEPILLNEPTRISDMNSRTYIELQRGPGFYGLVNVPFIMEAQDGSVNITDLSPVTGYIVFADREVYLSKNKKTTVLVHLLKEGRLKNCTCIPLVF